MSQINLKFDLVSTFDGQLDMDRVIQLVQEHNPEEWANAQRDALCDMLQGADSDPATFTDLFAAFAREMGEPDDVTVTGTWSSAEE